MNKLLEAASTGESLTQALKVWLRPEASSAKLIRSHGCLTDPSVEGHMILCIVRMAVANAGISDSDDMEVCRHFPCHVSKILNSWKRFVNRHDGLH